MMHLNKTLYVCDICDREAATDGKVPPDWRAATGNVHVCRTCLEIPCVRKLVDALAGEK